MPSAEWAERMTAAYREDTDRLGIGRPDSEPLASETIAEIVALIEALVEGDHAYESGGDVYFRVRSFAGYGKLSNRDPDQMDQGEEAGSAGLKEDPLDFALWKAAQGGRGQRLAVALGRGAARLAHRVLGDGGEGARPRLRDPRRRLGPDLPPPRERAGPERGARAGCRSPAIWMHNGMVQLDAEKMSKSVGNIFQLSEALDRYGPEAVVAYLGSGHYRQPLAFSDDLLEEAKARVAGIRNFLDARAAPASGEPEDADPFVAEKRE